MLEFSWNNNKNDLLKQTRNISFEEISEKLQNDEILKIINNPSPRYPHQKIFLIEINDYIFMVPYMQWSNKIFLKTIIPSRKYTKLYLGGKK